MSHGRVAGQYATPRSAFYDTGRFDRLFLTLPPFAADTQLVRDALAELGAVSGPMDAADDLALPQLAAADLDDLAPFHLQQRTPLWFYVLREAEVLADGRHLGPVGGRLVAEVIIGLITGDRLSYLRQDPDWTPTYGTGNEFTVADLLRAASVVAPL